MNTKTPEQRVEEFKQRGGCFAVADVDGKPWQKIPQNDDGWLLQQFKEIEEDKHKEGWHHFLPSQRLHYFVIGRPLCRGAGDKKNAECEECTSRKREINL